MRTRSTIAIKHPAFIYLIALILWVGVTIPAYGQKQPLTHEQPQPSARSFKVKGFYIDCRTQVMTIGAIKSLVDDLSRKGINTLIMEYEATFPFHKHATLCNEYAFTEADVKGLVTYCAERGIEVIPLQNCFGHCEYILRHDRYATLREDMKEVSQVCPLKIKEAKAVFGEIFREIAALHPSKYFHIGADETYLLGSCKHCAAVAAKEGKSRLFVDYIKAMSEVVLEMGKTPIIWADIILMHPEAANELPKELVFVDWNYGWEPDRFGKLENLFATGAEVWGAPSLRSGPDNVYLTQWEKHFNNLSTYIPFARQKGYQGIIETSWSTSGTYGFHYDTMWEVINMQPIRNVYPMSGFNILVDAFCTAANSPAPLEGHSFVLEYAKKQYGLAEAEGEVLWKYFTHPQELIGKDGKDVKGMPIAKVLEDAIRLREQFNKLVPKMNTAEFDHYKLMLDLRINYLAYKKIESFYESPAYDRSYASVLANQLKPLITEAAQLDERFSLLSRNYLKENQSEEINHIRSEKMKTLYQWLTHNVDSTPMPCNIIIPRPLQQEETGGKAFLLSAKTVITCLEKQLAGSARILSEQLMPVLNYKLKVETGKQRKGSIHLLIDNQLEPEAYSLDISEAGAVLKGGSAQGVFHGLQSLRQLVVAYAGTISASTDPTATSLPALKISDKPFFKYRASMLDVCRHFFTVDEVKKHLDILSLHKINTFHWHLTDDQGWRIEIKKYPELTRIGSVREGTVVGHLLANKEIPLDGKPYGGYYTQEDIREIVRYASERFIEVIPEVEMPGHAGAALGAYPWLGCKGEGYKVYPYWGINSDVFCAGKESTFEFMQNVLAEVIELFPSRYIHIGGDECPKVRWKECPQCQQRMKDNQLTDEHELQAYFMKRMEQWLKQHGKSIIGWEEILEGGISQTATVMSWRSSKGGIEAAKKGNMAIMAPKDHSYFDYYQGPKETEPLSIGGYVPVENVYKLDPYDQLNEHERKFILGVQANLWTEYIPSISHVQYMILPRLAALSEAGWAYDRKDYMSFLVRMSNMRKIYDSCGYNYAKHIF